MAKAAAIAIPPGMPDRRWGRELITCCTRACSIFNTYNNQHYLLPSYITVLSLGVTHKCRGMGDCLHSDPSPSPCLLFPHPLPLSCPLSSHSISFIPFLLSLFPLSPSFSLYFLYPLSSHSISFIPFLLTLFPLSPFF